MPHLCNIEAAFVESVLKFTDTFRHFWPKPISQMMFPWPSRATLGTFNTQTIPLMWHYSKSREQILHGERKPEPCTTTWPFSAPAHETPHVKHSRTFPLQAMDESWDGSGRARRAAIPAAHSLAAGRELSLSPERAKAQRGQELPSLSVDSEKEFAILNTARVHRHVNGTASPSVPVKLLLPCLLPLSSGSRPFPRRQQHEHSSLLL